MTSTTKMNQIQQFLNQDADAQAWFVVREKDLHLYTYASGARLVALIFMILAALACLAILFFSGQPPATSLIPSPLILIMAFIWSRKVVIDPDNQSVAIRVGGRTFSKQSLQNRKGFSIGERIITESKDIRGNTLGHHDQGHSLYLHFTSGNKFWIAQSQKVSELKQLSSWIKAIFDISGQV